MLNPVTLVFLSFAALMAAGHSPIQGAALQSQTHPTASDERVVFPEGSGGQNQAEHLDAPYVVLVSLDGFRYDYMDLFETPNLHRISDAGVRSEGLIPVFPVKTFPNHYSIATGMYADSHGIVGNSFYEAEFAAHYRVADRDEVENGRWYGGEPIWVTAETQGMVSASYFWVGSEAPVMGVQPTYWYHFDSGVPYVDRVDQVIEWLGRPAESRPHMITLYMEETDNQGHVFATDSPEMLEAVSRVDGLIGRLLDGIDALSYGDQVHVIVVSDHGMGRFTAEQSYFLKDLIDLGEGVDVMGGGPHMIMYVQGDTTRKDQLRNELAAVLPRVRVYRTGDMPERFHYASAGERLGDITLVPDFGWSVFAHSAADRPATGGWTHGWDRDTPQMRGLFVAAGPRIVQGPMLPEIENVHIYPFLVELLGLDPNPGIDGRLEVLGRVIR